MKKSKVKKNKKTASKKKTVKKKTAKKIRNIKVRTKRKKKVIKEESQKVKIRPKIEDIKEENAPLGIVFKLFVFLLIITLNWSGAFGFSYTYAYFSDGELSLNNSLNTGTLDFSLRSGQPNFVPPEFASNLNPGQSVARDIYVKKEGSLPFTYGVHSEPVDGSCDLEFYNILELRVWYNYYFESPSTPDYNSSRIMSKKYQGPLKDFNISSGSPDLTIPNNIHPYFSNSFYGPEEQWLYFQVIYPEGEKKLFDKSCEFKFVFEGEQVEGHGFSDQEEIYSTLVDGMLIEEVTPEPVVKSGGGGVILEATEDPENNTTSEENGSSSQEEKEDKELPDEELLEEENGSSSQEAEEQDNEEEEEEDEEEVKEEIASTSSSTGDDEEKDPEDEGEDGEKGKEETPAELKEESEESSEEE
jgi:hypothetical protein